MREDEIQILGKPHHTRKKWWWWVIVAIIFVVAIMMLIIYTANNSRRQAVLKQVETDVNPLSVLQSQESGLYEFDTEINDLHIYTLHLVNMETALTQSTPEYADTTLLLSLVATKKLPIAGDLVIDGKLMARGKPMKGFCAIVNGNVAIGETSDDDVLNYCIENHGSFFRQHMLVKDGKICDTPIKGKAMRCALARQGNDMYVVFAENEESVHDFAETLIDIGVLHAILLDEDLLTFYFKEEVKDMIYEPESIADPKEETNYLIFKKR